MPTKKKASIKRKVQNTERRLQPAQQQIQNATIDATGDYAGGTNATMNAQFAFLESQIALLQAQNAELNAEVRGYRAGLSGRSAGGTIGSQKPAVGSMQSEVGSMQSEVGSWKIPSTADYQLPTADLKLPTDYSQPATRNSQPKVGPNPLPAPTLVIMSVSSSTIVVDWDKVTNASGYIIEVANDSLFTNPVSLNADATATSWNIDGLNANTTYYIRVMATGVGAHGNSGFSNVQSIKTLNDGPGGMGDGIVGDLQTWLAELQTGFQNMAALIPQLENTVLDTTDRRRLLGSGVRRYGFIEKVLEVAGEYPQFWPGVFEDEARLRERVAEIDVLRNLLVWFRYATRIVGDMLLIAGDDAFRIAGSYYATARDSARRKLPEAIQVFQLLQLFWRRRRRMMDEPTEHEVERDVRALLRGSKDGTVSVSNESDQVTRGEKVLVDHTVPAKQHGGVKVVENAEMSRQ